MDAQKKASQQKNPGGESYAFYLLREWDLDGLAQWLRQDPEARPVDSKTGDTLLIAALKEIWQGGSPRSRWWGATGLARAVELALPHSDPLAQDKNGVTALMLAAGLTIDSETARKTIEAIAPLSDLSTQDGNGQTALAWALQKNRDWGAQSVAALAGGSDFKAKDANGRTPLMIAAVRGVVEWLTPWKDRWDLSEKDPSGLTALMLAIKNGRVPDILELWPLSSARDQDNNGQTALMHLAGSPAGNRMPLEVHHAALRAGNANAQDNNGDTALHLIARKSRSRGVPEDGEWVKDLARASDMSIKNHKGESVADLALREQAWDLVGVALEKPQSAASLESLVSKLAGAMGGAAAQANVEGLFLSKEMEIGQKATEAATPSRARRAL